MSIIQSAIHEMKAAGYEEGDIVAMEDILRRFFAQWDSGGAVSVMVPVLDRLLRGLPLNCLTGDDDEWEDRSEYGPPLHQNLRCGTVFKRPDGTFFDVDNPSWDGSFPYLPPRARLDPVIEFQT